VTLYDFILKAIKAAFQFALNALSNQPKGILTMSLIIADDQQVGLSIAPKDKKGNAAKIDGIPVWESSDSAILEVTASAESLSATVVAVGPLGTAQISCRADADLGAGVVELIGTLDIEVIGGQATTLGIIAGSPVPQP
jgi:hypothetical protein